MLHFELEPHFALTSALILDLPLFLGVFLLSLLLLK